MNANYVSGGERKQGISPVFQENPGGLKGQEDQEEGCTWYHF